MLSNIKAMLSLGFIYLFVYPDLQAQQKMISVNGVRLTIKENTSLSVKGSICVNSSTSNQQNIHNEGAIIWRDSQGNKADTLENKSNIPLFISSSNPFLDSGSQSAKTYGLVGVYGSNTKVIKGNDNFYFNNIFLANNLKLLTQVRTFGAVTFNSGIIDLNSHSIYLYDLSSDVMRRSGALLGENNLSHITDSLYKASVVSNKLGSSDYGNMGFRTFNDFGTLKEATVYRYQSQLGKVTNGSISKYFDFVPEGASGLNGNITLRYFDSDYKTSIGSRDSMGIFHYTSDAVYEHVAASVNTRDSLTTASGNNISAGFYTVADTNCFNPPVIHFSQENYSTCEGKSLEIVCSRVTQKDISNADSTVIPVSYSWKGFDNPTGTLKLENISYSAGETISLTVKTKDGCSSTKAIVLTTYKNPLSKIKVLPWKSPVRAGGYCEGDSVIVTDSLAHTGGTYLWYPANPKYNGNEYRYSLNSLSANTSVNFALTYTDINGCEVTSSTSAVFIAKPKPAIAFDNSSVCLGNEIIIHNNTSNSSGISEYKWILGNGDSISVTRDHFVISGTEPVDTSHASKIILGMDPPGMHVGYGNPGTYLIRLKAINTEGCSDSTFNTATVFPKVTARIRMITSDTVCLSTGMAFCAKDTSGAEFISGYHWMIFNSTGSLQPLQEFTTSRLDDTIRYEFSSPGLKRIGLEVWSDNGCSDITYRNVYVAPRPTASFSAVPVCLGSPSLLANSSSSGNQEKYDWAIEGADIIKTDTARFSHTFTDDGLHRIFLKVENKYGCTDTLSQAITVWSLPKASLETRNACINAQGTDTLLVNHSQDAYASTWQFGDGTTSTVYQPMKKYADAKTFHVMLSVSNIHGCIAETNDSIAIYGTLSPSVAASNDCEGNTINFTASSGAASYHWEFGDGVTFDTAACIASHMFRKAGTYNTKLEIRTDKGCLSSTSKNLVIYPVPVASFHTDPVCKGENSEFELSDSASINQNCSYFWDFGDNSTSNVPNTLHTYTETGSYPVKLTVTSSNHCFSSSTMLAMVNTLPEAHFGSLTGTCESHIALQAKNDQCTYLWNDQSSADTLYVVNNGTYSVTIQNTQTGCSIKQSTVVKLHSQILPGLSDISSCGPVMVKTSVYDASYLWSTGSASQSITLSDTGTYTVYVTVTKDGCSGYDTATVSIHPLPLIELAAGSSLCYGDRTTLDPHVPNVGNTYAWSSSDATFGNPSTSSVTLTNSTTKLITSRYYVTVTSPYNCKATGNTDVTFRPKISLDLGQDLSVCDGATHLFDASIRDAAGFLWNDGYIVSSRTISTSVNGSQNPLKTNWWVKATDKYGCQVFDTVSITANPIPAITLNTTYSSCSGDTITIDASQPGNNNYLWDPLGIKTPVLKLYQNTGNASTQNIRLEITNSYGCSASSGWSSVAFRESPKKELPVLTESCNSAVLNAGNPGASFAWDNGYTGEYRVIDQSGTYKVKITNAGNCSIDDSVKVTILTIATPNLGGYKTVCSNSVLDLVTGINNPDYSFLWNDNSSSPSLRVSTSGKYWVRATHTNGCSASDTVVVESKQAPSVDLGPDVDLCSNEYFAKVHFITGDRLIPTTTRLPAKDI